MISFDINNFQSIKSTSLTVDGFTVLIGENNIGKSATFRAIQALFKNRAGDGFISKGTTYSSVICSYNGNTITWHKPAKGGAEYAHLAPNASKPVTYSKVGRKAPDFINELGFGEVELKAGKLDPHFSKQREAPFLLSSSNQILTEFFSELLKFGPLGKASLEVTKDLRKQNSNLKVLEKEIEGLESSISNFPDLITMESDLNGLEDSLNSLMDLQTTLNEVTHCIDLKKSIIDVPDYSDSLDAKLAETYAIQDSLEAIESLRILKEQAFTPIPEFDLVAFDIVESLWSYLQLLDIEIPEIDDTLLLKAEYYLYRKEYLILIKNLKEIDATISKLESDFDSMLTELGMCPLCQRSTHDK